MPNQKLYLKYQVQAEPLLRQWYAVSLLIPPATGAMFLANSHVKIMKSYVLSPEMHAAASQDPSLIGGPFINYQEDRTEEVGALLERTLREKKHIIDFAGGVRALDEMLRKEAGGFSLEPLYPKVPEPLRGYVELVYDLNNASSFRFIEHLLYRSPIYDSQSQGIGLTLVSRDDRPFVMSTPRLEDGGYMHLNIPFADRRLDDLFRLRSEPRPMGEIKEMLGVDGEGGELFGSFFTPEAPGPPAVPRYEGEGMRVRYFGHACLLVETRNVSILTDPMISYKYDSDIPRFTFADLPERIDYVLITHAHLDHIVLEPLLQLRHKIGQIVVPRNGGGFLQDPSLKLLLNSVGFHNVVDVDEFESVRFEGGEVISLPFFGEHHDLNIRSRTGYLISSGGKSVAIAADSCNLETRLCEYIHAEFGDIDALFLGMECDGAPLSWFYGPLLTRSLDRRMDYSRQGSACNYARAIDMTTALGCKSVWIYAMGLEPWLNYIMSINWTEESVQITESNKFVDDCRGRGIGAERLFGQKTILL